MTTFTSKDEYGLSRRIERLIEAWQELQDKRRQLDEFQEKQWPPEPPREFDSVGGLIEFVRKRDAYKVKLAGYSARLQEAEEAFAEVESWFIGLLPEGVPLVYEYQSCGTGSAEKQFRIVEVSPDGTPRIEVEELDART